MSDQATPQRDSDDDKDHGPDVEQSDQNRETQQPGAVPDHSGDRPTDPDPGQEAA
jgi:hypothetical protein